MHIPENAGKLVSRFRSSLDHSYYPPHAGDGRYLRLTWVPGFEAVRKSEILVIPGLGGSPRARNPYVDGPRLARLGSADDGSGRLRSYVRPLRAARMAAGPDGLRGSGPEQGSDV